MNAAQQALHDALRALADRRFDDALALAHQALAGALDADVPLPERGEHYDQPEHARAHYVVGTARLETGDSRGAVDAFDAALRAEPNERVSLSNRAIAKRNLGDLAGAVADFSRALSIDPRYSHARANRARVLATLGELERADADFVALLAVANTPDHRAEWNAVREKRGLAHDDATLAALQRR